MNSSMVSSLLIAASACATIVLTSPVNSSSVTVTVDPNTGYQTFEGWGTSLCWWAITSGKWNETNRNNLIGAIVDPDTGLGYNCFRYNIGGGDQPGHTHLSGVRAVPGFKPTESGAYDWTADPYQRNILLGIAARGKDLVFEAFSNSPPWWMTVNGCASGNKDGADNLKPAYFTAFADYLTEVVKHYKEVWGITFRTVEPFNEPSSGYWKENGGQEGCGFKSQQSKMIKELGKKLVEKNLFPTVKVSAADETSLDQAMTSIKSYDDSAFSYLSQINSHSYGGWAYRKTVDSLAQVHKKNLWQSESGPLGKGDKDTTDITMWMSNVIIQDLRQMKPNAWIDWQVCDPVENWRSIEINDSRQSFKYNKRFYMHAAFSRFIRPGSRIISSSDTNSVAALVPSTGNLVVVLRNNAYADKDYTIDLSKCNTLGTSALIYRFALPEGTLKKQADIPVDNKKVSFTAPKQSITTCVVSVSTSIGKSKINTHAYGNLSIDFSNNVLRFSLISKAHYRLDLYNSIGKRILSIQGNQSSLSGSIDLNRNLFPGGMYIAELRQNGIIKSQKLFIFRE